MVVSTCVPARQCCALIVDIIQFEFYDENEVYFDILILIRNRNLFGATIRLSQFTEILIEMRFYSFQTAIYYHEHFSGLAITHFFQTPHKKLSHQPSSLVIPENPLFLRCASALRYS
jgi:hypothetical protein